MALSTASVAHAAFAAFYLAGKAGGVNAPVCKHTEGPAPFDFFLDRIEGFLVDDSLMCVLNIILWQLTLILSRFLCQWVNHIFLLKEKVTGVGNVSKNLADGCISKVLSLIGLYPHFFELLFCGLSGETFEKIVEDEFYDFGFFWFNDKMVTFPAIAVNHKATVWNSLFETFSGAPFDIVADTDAFFLCKGCQKRQHDLAIAGE